VFSTNGLPSAVMKDQMHTFVRKWSAVLAADHLPRAMHSVESEAHFRYQESMLWIIDKTPVIFHGVNSARSDRLIQAFLLLGYDVTMQPTFDLPFRSSDSQNAHDMALRFKGVQLNPPSAAMDQWELASTDVCLYGLVVVSGGYWLMKKADHAIRKHCPFVSIAYDTSAMLEAISAIVNDPSHRVTADTMPVKRLINLSSQWLDEHVLVKGETVRTHFIVSSEIEAAALKSVFPNHTILIVPRFIQEPLRQWQEAMEEVKGAEKMTVEEFMQHSGGGRGMDVVRSHNIQKKRAMSLTMAKCLNRPMFFSVAITPPYEVKGMEEGREEWRLVDSLMRELWFLLDEEEKTKVHCFVFGSSKKQSGLRYDDSSSEAQIRPWDGKIIHMDVSDHLQWSMVEDGISIYSRVVVAIPADPNGTRGALNDVSLIGLTRVSATGI
jgi:hypothetical protein